MSDQSTGVLSKEEILERLQAENEDRLVVTPLVDDKQVSEGSIDLRLNTEFIVTKRTKFGSIDPVTNRLELDSLIMGYQERTYVKLGDGLNLHPNQWILGSSLEYIKLPNDLMAYVVGRSSWGRLGLIIATAPIVHPRYAGVITLELANLGDAPLKLYPGIRVAQLVLHKTKKGETLSPPSKYQYSVGPMFSRVHKDEDLGKLAAIQKQNKNLG